MARTGRGWTTSANQFHYYRLSADNRILFGGYDAVYRFGKRVRAGARAPAATSTGGWSRTC